MPSRAQARKRPEPEDVLRVISPAFDPDFYRAIYTDLPAEMAPLWHYRMAGCGLVRAGAAPKAL